MGKGKTSPAKLERALPLPDRAGFRSFKFDIPFVKDISKNRIFFAGMGKKGFPIMRRRGSVNKLQKGIAQAVALFVGSEPWPKAKTWIDVIVQKPDHRSDAHNTIDTLLDAIKAGLQIDDREFAIGMLDWEIKPEGRIYVQVSVKS